MNMIIKIFLLFFLFSLQIFGRSKDIVIGKDFKWGTSIDDFTREIPQSQQVDRFNLEGRPDFNNRMIDYLTGINRGIINSVYIIKLINVPESDYLFIKKKLYIISHLWEKLDEKKEKKILDSFNSEYGLAEIKKEHDVTVYSYNHGNTKILLYKFKILNGDVKLKVYYYPKNLFKILFMD